MATIISLGSMIQYAFLFILLPMVLIGILFKCIHFRETIALVMGLIAPYWVTVGMGIIPPENFTMPRLINIFDVMMSTGALYFSLVNIAVSALACFIIGLYNSMKLYAGNPRRRLFNIAFNVIGLTTAVCMVCDYYNFTAYIVTFFICCALQIANMFALWNLRKPRIIGWIICLIYTSLYTAALLT